MSRYVYQELGSRPGRAVAWERYYDYLKTRRRRPRTIDVYRSILADRFWPFVERRGKQWHQVTRGDLDAFLGRRAAVRSGRPYLSDNTKHQESVTILRFYRWAADTKLLPTNRLAGLYPWPAARPVERALELEDVRSLLVWTAGDSRLETAVWLCYGAGLRVGEAAALRVEDVILRGDRPRLRVVDGKGGRSRTVPLAPPVVEVLTRHLANRPGTGPVLESRHPRGGPVSANAVSRMLGTAMREAGLADSAHALRHTFATVLLSASHGRDLYAVSKLLGHQSTRTTETIYTNSYAGPVDETVARLPNPRAARGQDASSPHSGDPSPWLPVDLADQLAAALKTLDAHGEAVATAMRAVGEITTACWLRSLGVTDLSQLDGLDLDAIDYPSDDEWERFEIASGLRRGWTLADRLRDAHPDE